MARYLFLVTQAQVRIFDFFGKPTLALCVELADAPPQMNELALPNLWRWFQDYRADDNSFPFEACVLAEERTQDLTQALISLLAKKGGHTEVELWPPTLLASFYHKFYPETQVHSMGETWQVGTEVQRLYVIKPVQIKPHPTDENKLTAVDVQRYLQKITAGQCLWTDFG